MLMEHLMMKKLTLLPAAVLLVLSTANQAGEYPQNPVVRPLTLNQSTIELTGAYFYGKQHDNDHDSILAANMSYGLTDNLQLALDGITYSFLKNKHSGLELAVKASLSGYYDDKNGDNLGLGFSVLGKQIINKDFAFTFGAGYTHWNLDNLADRSEYDYSVGMLMNIAPQLTLSAQYTYRDLKDFAQSHANSTTVGLNYAIEKNIDLGLVVSYSDYNEQTNSYALLETPEAATGLYINYRF